MLTARNSISVPLPRYELAAEDNLPVYLFHHFNKLLQQQQAPTVQWYFNNSCRVHYQLIKYQQVLQQQHPRLL